jgi:hypothetical protein
MSARRGLSWLRGGENLPPVMLGTLSRSLAQLWDTARRRWPALLVLALATGWVLFAITLSDEQGRFALPRAYSVKMTCEDDPEAALWHGGCDRVAADIAKTERPGFLELYTAFVDVHHVAGPREAAAARAGDDPADPSFDVGALLAGQRYGLAMVAPEFEGVKSRRHAEAVMEEIDKRDRALLAIGRAGLGYDALIAGALANLAHPGAMVTAASQYVAILMGTAKRSDLATGAPAKR